MAYQAKMPGTKLVITSVFRSGIEDNFYKAALNKPVALLLHPVIYHLVEMQT